MKLPHTDEVPDALYEAARVSRFMAEAESGRWRLRKFTVTEAEAELRTMRAVIGRHPSFEVLRVVPAGEYITLQRRMTARERLSAFRETTGMPPARYAKRRKVSQAVALDRVVPLDVAWVPIMSDTPAEILEHFPALNGACGEVLITGLGLGCLPHALLSLPDVTRIDIIEIDPEVIALTGHYLLRDPRVRIHNANALAPDTVIEAGCHFDYVWHDIWSQVGAANLDDSTAEHGISYDRLFDVYADLYEIDAMDAWGHTMALAMERERRAEADREAAFQERLRAAPLDEQVTLTLDHIIADALRMQDPYAPVDPQVRAWYLEHMGDGGKLEARVRDALSDPHMWEGFDAWRAALALEDEPGDHPNAHLEGGTEIQP